MNGDPKDIIEDMESLIEHPGWLRLCQWMTREISSPVRFMGVQDLQGLGRAQGRVEAIKEVLDLPRGMLVNARRSAELNRR